jgi:hypothetical protein
MVAARLRKAWATFARSIPPPPFQFSPMYSVSWRSQLRFGHAGHDGATPGQEFHPAGKGRDRW